MWWGTQIIVLQIEGWTRNENGSHLQGKYCKDSVTNNRREISVVRLPEFVCFTGKFMEIAKAAIYQNSPFQL
jgi:hypothetical protein